MISAFIYGLADAWPLDGPVWAADYSKILK